MWQMKVGVPALDLKSNGDEGRSDSEKSKRTYELRILNLLIAHGVTTPVSIRFRESPDFEVTLADRSKVWVELVDATPNAVEEDERRVNADKRRSQPNQAPYRIEPDEFGRRIAEMIEGKRAKARKWIAKDPALAGNLVLIVNAGKGALTVRDYLRTEAHFSKAVGRPPTEPFRTIIVGDEGGAFVARAEP